ncbi:putative cobaltochelatase [Modestobacter muralis]|uniref:Mg-protoporphyrin IX chelatase n=1 Tax=Modestobacter muralis TaxID=1608614 RepID=A0A6P0H6P4_9ACTN|nr:putative cobaltochelatase [Modestobacter muralis]NEK94610.1 putative cobaltochelatase [Modestobacter muralis]NEN51498.1 putative cobaltochelatase [Modestobacter muralis]
MTYPFGAVVGMDDLRLALLLNAVSPAVGGVLVRGEKGTAKSTTVRALAAVLPPVDVVAGCRFACDPAAPDAECPDGPHPSDSPAVTRPARLVELPVGASEDRLVGSLDLERALTEGVKSFEPGLLAGANRGVLYVDEVNLLHDHLVDLLLDAAALGRAYVEREGVSVRHAARFLLVGTMNPEEGELRPQLLDRFGLTVEVAAPRDPDLRAEVVRRRFGYDADPAAFAAAWAESETELAVQIATARALLPRVVLSDAALRQVTSVCAAFDVDGLRADLVTARAAIAHAAWSGRTDVTEDDVRTAARLALPHRRRRNPFDAPGLDEETLEQALADSRPEDSPPDDDPTPPEGTDPTDGGPDGDGGGTPPPSGDPGKGTNTGGSEPDTQGKEPMPGDDGPTTAPRGEGGGHTDAAPAPEQAAVAPDAPFRVQRLEVPGIGAGASGRRSKARSERGRVVGSRRPEHAVTKLHLVDTVLAAAPHQRARGRSGTGLLVERTDLRQATLEGREGNLVLFVVDASGSMGARSRMAAVKGAVLSLLMDAYQRRDKVGLITFRGGEAELTLPPTWSVEAAAARLTSLPTGGRTPLAAGLLRAHETLRLERVRDPQRRPLVVLVTDGRATGARGTDSLGESRRAAALLASTGVASVVVDCESGPVRLGLAATLGAVLGAQTMRLEQLGAEQLVATVREAA